MSSSASAPPARASVPVVTDATAADAAELADAASLFIPKEAAPLSFTRNSGGVNNKCYRVSVGNVEALPQALRGGDGSFILRIYNNGGNTPRVAYEHEVLRQLHADSPGKGSRAASLLPVLLPQPLPPLVTASPPSSFAPLSSTRAEACLFRVIPGRAPELASARSIGRATARLVKAMEGMRLDSSTGFPLPNPLYQNIWEAHWKINRESFLKIVAGPEFDAGRADTEYLVAEIASAERLIADILREDALPRQQIHADLHFDNVLVDDASGEVTGILDFEFSAFDWRVMELVVGLSKYAGMKEPSKPIAEYIAGYGEGGGRLRKRERELVPDLVILRVLSNVVYFAGRALAGEDSLAPLTGRVGVYAARCRWLHAQREWLVGALAPLAEE